jgi:dihydrofolate reductase
MPKDVILIAAVTIDGLIARHRHEVITWSKDLHLFKEQTLGSNVIMGSNTHNILSTELEGRKTIVIHRNDDPESILKDLSVERCYIVGGGKTYARFAPFLTHLYITPHPLVFGKGIPLFDGLVPDLDLIFQQMVCVDEKDGIFQYQYRVRKS